MPKIYVKLVSLAAATLAVWLIIPLLVHNLASFVYFADTSEYLQTVFVQLKTADIFVPLWLPALISGAYLLIPWKRKWRVWLISVGLILFILLIPITLFFTKVNSVPFGKVIIIVYDIFTSGALENLS